MLLMHICNRGFSDHPPATLIVSLCVEALSIRVMPAGRFARFAGARLVLRARGGNLQSGV